MSCSFCKELQLSFLPHSLIKESLFEYIFFSMQAENHRRQRGYTTVGDLEGCVHYKVGKSGAQLQLNPEAGQFAKFKGGYILC